MKKTFIIIILKFALIFNINAQKKVLFIGNSYTGVNNLPGMLAELANANNDLLIYDSNTPGGYTLGASPNLHCENTTTLNKINSDNWDYVVLQEQSQIPTVEYYRENTMYYGARILDSLIHENNECTQTLFYLTWGRKFGGLQNLGDYSSVDFVDFNQMQDTLTSAYLEIAQELNATVSPVGVAWKKCIAANPDINLFSSDNSHPSIYGTYLTACVFYATIFQKTPFGISFYSSLNEEEAKILQNIAESTVFDNMQLWNIHINPIHASFDYENNNGEVNFINSSENAEAYFWEINNLIIEEENPVYQYTENGEYQVKLIAYNECFRDTIIKTVIVDDIFSVEKKEVNLEQKISLYPNPCEKNAILYFENIDIKFIEILDNQGKVIKKFEYFKKKNIHLNNFKKGIYFIKIYKNKDIFCKKWIVL